MSLTAPPRPPTPTDPVDRDELEALVNALIEEARRRARRRRRIIAAVVTSAALVGVAVFAVFDRVAQSQSTSSPVGARPALVTGSTRARIAFTTGVVFRQGNADLVRSDLYVMNADGSDKRRLTRSDWGFYQPAWSPDGRRIAFEERLDPRRWGGQCGGCNVEIYVVNADGTGRRNLTRNAGYDAGAVWSPDGQKIAYIGSRGKGSGPWGKADIYVMNADGSSQQRLTPNPQADLHPVWSPDGRQIAFTSWHSPNWDIWVMNADGSGLENLTKSRAQEWAYTWSPDGRKLAFVRTRNTTERSDRGWELYVVNADGSGQRRLLRTARPINAPPAWSPDERRLLFVALDPTGDNSEISVMNADGSELHSLTPAGHSPAWSPDGRKIAFISTRLGPPAVYLMNPDGSGVRNLTPGIRGLGTFAWSTAGVARS